MHDYSKPWNSRGAGKINPGSRSRSLPDGRNAGQKDYLSIQQNCQPGAGSPEPTQAPKSARGIKTR